MKLRVKKDALRIRQASLILDKPYTLQAVKISEPQAAVFRDNMNFEFVLALYGKENRLQVGEEYSGYVVIMHNGVPEVNYMTGGKIILETEKPIWNYNIAKFVEKGHYMRVEGGALQYVWAFNCCSNELMYSVKLKLTHALLHSISVELTDEENDNLHRYLGEYYQKFFIFEF